MIPGDEDRIRLIVFGENETAHTGSIGGDYANICMVYQALRASGTPDRLIQFKYEQTQFDVPSFFAHMKRQGRQVPSYSSTSGYSYYYGMTFGVPVNSMTLWVTARFFGSVSTKERITLPKPGKHIIEWAVPSPITDLYGLEYMPSICHGEGGLVIYEPRYAPRNTEVDIRDAIRSGLWTNDPFANERK